MAAPLPSPGATLTVNTNVLEETIPAWNGNVRYTFSSYGGGLKLVEFFPERERGGAPDLAATNQVATLNTYTAVPTMALLDGATVQGDGIFKLTRTEGGVRAEKALTNGLSIVKEFVLSTNYLVATSIRLENHSAKPLDLPSQEWFVGTAPRVPPAEYLAGSSNVVWVAAHNQYFVLAAMPLVPAQGMVVRKVQLPARSAGEYDDIPRFPPLLKAGGQSAATNAEDSATNAPPQDGYQAGLIYPGQKLAPNQTLERHLLLYAGPKEYQRLARIGERLGNNLDLVMNFGWSGFVSKALLIGMNWLHHGLRISYGAAVVAITFIIKIVFWPLTQASTRSMKRMQALQPQIKAIQAKFKDDPMKLQRRTMEFYKEQKVNPMSGCFPMLIQVPVFIGFYSMISSAIELRGAHFLWIKDLAKPDTLFIIPGLGILPILGIPGVGLPFNLLPLIMGGTMLWQAHLTPPSPGMDPAQAKLMRYLPLIFILMLYGLSSGLTLYWTVNNLLSIAQTKLTKTTPGPEPAAKAAKGPVLTISQKKKK
jgi:YidC/Oxa1 family membrane protein insertase